MQSNRDLVVEPVGVKVESLPKPINWQELFGNDHPVEFEIGTGKGTFLTDSARARPDTNFFGIEYAAWFWRYASDRLRRHNCTNAHTARAEANFFFREYVPSDSLSVLHIYFPDPWPKKRHHKRRLIQPEFLQQVMRTLKVGGQLRIVTDHAGYFEQINEVVRASPLEIIDYTRPSSAGEEEFVGTNFERKYKREARPFNAIAGVKKA